MRHRVALLILSGSVVSALFQPAGAVSSPIFTCKWSGFLHVLNDWSFEGLIMWTGSGNGRCTGPGAGPYDITMSTSFADMELNNSFLVSPRFELRSERTGSVRKVAQDFHGRLTSDCTFGPFRVDRYPDIPVGFGKMSLCPSLDPGFAPPEPIDVAVQFTWRFVMGRL